ncbi:MAG TPA: DUF5698 domain-containing protein [Spirillospora sp.]|nr:DUF5698 domain-containing protein [Spirillospora sp.]
MEFTQEGLLLAVVIFLLRVLNSAVGTVRLVVMGRGRYLLTAVLGFVEALIFAWVTANVITDLSNIFNLVAYCSGFSVGIYVGMAIEARFVTSYVKVNIITSNGDQGREMARKLRESGHGVTEIRGAGAAGEVIMLSSVVYRINVPEVLKTVYAINPKAFVTLEEARSVQHGWLRALRHTK